MPFPRERPRRELDASAGLVCIGLGVTLLCTYGLITILGNDSEADDDAEETPSKKKSQVKSKAKDDAKEIEEGLAIKGELEDDGAEDLV